MARKDNIHQVMILEESDCFYQGIKTWLNPCPDISLYPKIMDWEYIQQAASKLDGTILITSLHWIHFQPGFEEFRLFLENNKHCKVLCFVIPCPEFTLGKLISTGILGFIDWSAKAEEFILAIKEVSAGRLFVSARLPEHDEKKSISHPPVTPPENLGLTKREMEVLCLICQGHSSKEIAAKLFLSKRTIDGYRASLLSKFGTNKSALMIRMVHEQQYH